MSNWGGAVKSLFLRLDDTGGVKAAPSGKECAHGGGGGHLGDCGLWGLKGSSCGTVRGGAFPKEKS